ncbi:MAG: hypothetical protein LBH80_07840 [Prevotellaceae bacterium]|jgi:hypothetical protein|nr:hypothetical protein [Prevotellaceae bacterium]
MNSILNNPYRTLGLLAGASAREINTRVNRLRMYIEAKVEVPKNEDFGFLEAMGKPKRTDTSVDKAKAELNLDNDKISHALFWFWKGNDITDEPAFDALKDLDADTAIEIWQKLTHKGEVTERNSSAFLNLSSLLLYLGMSRKTINKAYFEKGLRLKIQFLESPFFKDFVKKIGGETVRIEVVELEHWFLNQTLHDSEKTKGLTPAKMAEILLEQTFKAKKDFLKECSDALAKEIEDKVKTCSDKRSKTPEKANILGDELYSSVYSDLRSLEKIVGKNNLTYSNAADAVAEEILQCSIDFYNKSKNQDTEKLPLLEALNKVIEQPRAKTISNAQMLLAEAKPHLNKLKMTIDAKKKKGSINERKTALMLLEKAHSIAVGHAVKQRCEENKKRLPNNQEEPDFNTIYLNQSIRVADSALGMAFEEIKVLGITPQRREGIKRLLNEISAMDLTADYRKNVAQIQEQIANGGGDSKVNRTIDELIKLLKENKTIIPEEVEPNLRIVKDALGGSDDTYLQISTAIANKILGNYIEVINSAQERINDAYDKESALLTLKNIIAKAIPDINRLKNWDLTADFRNRLETNNSALSNLMGQLEGIIPPSPQKRNKWNWFKNIFD